ncbi:MAG: AAA family ATPase [Deltaproteobacteria bacterium]|nr:AAA family ATPase [Deltaproteobacteria bacterium]
MASGARVVVVGGKGGVGKTSVSAILVRLMLRGGGRLLVIDADPVISVSYTLGEQPAHTLGDFRQGLIESPQRQRDLESRPLKSAIRDLLTGSRRGYDLLAMGRAEGKGCFCGVNEMLRFGIESLCSEYDTVLVDCEAGIEQVNRRALHRIDELVLVADTSLRSMESVIKVRDIAASYNDDNPLGAHVLINKVGGEEDRRRALATATGLRLEIAGFVPEDERVRLYNAQGRTLMELPDDAPSVVALGAFVARIGVAG